jgi:hypothetical protein
MAFALFPFVENTNTNRKKDTNMKKTFADWMAAVDAIISRDYMGITTADLTDNSYGDWYEDGMTP